MRTLTVVVAPEKSGRTVKSILGTELHMAPSLISRVKLRENGICLNGLRVHTDAIVSAGDVVAADVSDISPCNPALPMDFPLEIVYEDEDLAIINKPAGMAVHGGAGNGRFTVASTLAYIWGPDKAFHPVNRLDRGTSGLMVAAKSGYIHDRLRRMLHTDDFIREYAAAAEGFVCPAEGSIELPMDIRPGEGGRRSVSPGGLASKTNYRTLGRKDGLTLLLVRPITGRTHQIRVHFSSVSHPLCGDALYGGGTELISRPALHSCRVQLVHPVTGKLIIADSPLPEDISALASGISFDLNNVQL